MPNLEKGNLAIYNSLGSKVMRMSVSGDETISPVDFAPGMYYFIFESGIEIQTGKFLIVR